MGLAALIAAYHETESPDAGLRATLPLAGRTLVERQARLAASAGAAPIVILVERIPPELASALDRLRGEGVTVKLARSPTEAAEAFHPEDRLLLLADGVVADESHVARLLSAGGNALLTVPDHNVGDRFERIDAHSRWAGLALVSGQALKQTVAMLHEWDLQSTLLRRAVQGGARQFSIRPEGAEGYLAIAAAKEDLEPVEQRIVESAVGRRDGWVSRYLLAPAEHKATRILMPTRVMPDWLRLLAVAITGLGTYCFARDWLWGGALLLLLSTPLDDIADRLSTLRMQSAEAGWANHLLPVFAAAALLALAWSLSWTYGWGAFVLALTTLAFVAATWLEADERPIAGRIFLAERKGMMWLMLPFAVTGSWLGGLLALVCYAAGSFFWAQRQVHRSPVGPADGGS